MDLMNSINTSASGMKAQSLRMKVISENIANADSVLGKNGEAYRRKTVHFKAVVDKNSGMTTVSTGKVQDDMKTPFKQVLDPSSPYADENGIVNYPNVTTTFESIDMRDATRLYEANMAAIESAKQMMVKSLNMLR